MDVAPWDKHWIKREFDGFGLYSKVFDGQGGRYHGC